jgi:hypothetical protein
MSVRIPISPVNGLTAWLPTVQLLVQLSKWGREDSNLRSLNLKAESWMATNSPVESSPPTR